MYILVLDIDKRCCQSTMVVLWIVGQWVEPVILHLGHVSHQIHLINLDCCQHNVAFQCRIVDWNIIHLISFSVLIVLKPCPNSIIILSIHCIPSLQIQGLEKLVLYCAWLLWCQHLGFELMTLCLVDKNQYRADYHEFWCSPPFLYSSTHMVWIIF